MLWFRDQRVEKKLRGALHHRIRASEKLFVAREFEVIPKVRAEPCAAGGPHAPEWSIDGSCLSPQIGVVMTHPTARAVMHPRSARAVLDQFGHHPQQRLVTLRQVRGFGRPVV